MPNARFTSRLAAIAAACLAFTATAQPQIVPSAPLAFERLHLRLTVDDCSFDKASVNVELRDRTLRVHHRQLLCLVPGAPEVVDIQLGALPAGDYAVELVDDANGATGERLAFRVEAIARTLEYPGHPFPLADYSGLWGTASEPGWGMTLQQGPLDAVFGTLLVFDRASQPQWYTLQAGRWTTATRWEGQLVRSEGPPWSAPVYAPDAARYVPVGAASLDFRTAPGHENAATLRYTIDGQTVTKTISRVRF